MSKAKLQGGRFIGSFHIFLLNYITSPGSKPVHRELIRSQQDKLFDENRLFSFVAFFFIYCGNNSEVKYPPDTLLAIAFYCV